MEDFLELPDEIINDPQIPSASVLPCLCSSIVQFLCSLPDCVPLLQSFLRAKIHIVCKTCHSMVIPTEIGWKTILTPWAETMIFGYTNQTQCPYSIPILFQGSGPDGRFWHWGSSALKSITQSCVSEASRMHLNPSLFASEGGLLFFTLAHGFIPNKPMHTGRGFKYDQVLVCNPLTGRYNFLSLSIPTQHGDLYTLVGVVSNDAHHGYKLLVGRFYRSCDMSLISIYDSHTSSWNHIQHGTVLDHDEQWSCQGERSISHNGVLYWLVQTKRKGGPKFRDTFLKTIAYDVEKDILSQGRAPLPSPGGWSQIENDNHFHELLAYNPFSQIVSIDGELLTVFFPLLNHLCFTDFGLSTNNTVISLLPEVLDKLREVDPNVGFSYSGFRHKDLFYHILLTLKGRLKIVIHHISAHQFMEVNLDGYFGSFPFWTFSPSWTALA